jgi:glycosyltransferase involved in cell wall biosynthesis
MRKNIVFITEYIDPPFDEGIKRTVYHIYNFLKENFNLLVICRKGMPRTGNVIEIKTNRLFFDRKMAALIREFNPSSLIYLPFASLTFAGFLRMKILSGFESKSRKILIALQPKPLNSWQKAIIRTIKPEKVLTPSTVLSETLSSLGIKNQIFPLYTDVGKFRPADNKSFLKKKYGIPSDRFIIIHIGHLNDERNLPALIPLQKNGNQVVIVGSSSTPSDAAGPGSLKQHLVDVGILVIDHYVDKIEEIYQLSDLYVFPVMETTGSIGIPLSILEARACGIPVLTSDFASIRHFLGNDGGGIFYSEPGFFSEKIESIKESGTGFSASPAISRLNTDFNNFLMDSIAADG